MSIPRTRIRELPDGPDADALWQPKSGSFSYFVCPICCEVPTRPVLQAIRFGSEVFCAHMFCTECLAEAMLQHLRCPDCDRTLAKNAATMPARIRLAWRSIEATCKWPGCGKIMSVAKIDEHEGRECTERHISCSAPTCTFIGTISATAEHERTCSVAIRRCRCGFPLAKDGTQHDCIDTLYHALQDAVRQLRLNVIAVPPSCAVFGESHTICTNRVLYDPTPPAVTTTPPPTDGTWRMYILPRAPTIFRINEDDNATI